MCKRSPPFRRFLAVLAALGPLLWFTAALAEDDDELQKSYSVARRHLRSFRSLEVYPTTLSYEVRRGKINLLSAFSTGQVDKDVAIQQQAFFADELLKQGCSTRTVQKRIDQRFAQLRDVSPDMRTSRQRKDAVPKELPVHSYGNALDIQPERLHHGYGGWSNWPWSSPEEGKPPHLFYGEIPAWTLPSRQQSSREALEEFLYGEGKRLNGYDLDMVP